MTLPLITGETTEILLTKTKLVSDPLAPEIQELLPKMIKTMHKEHGVGLAAPQINVPLRLAVAEVEGKEYYWINPEITSLSQEKIISEEREKAEQLLLAHKSFLLELSQLLTTKIQIQPNEFKDIAARHGVTCKVEDEEHKIITDYAKRVLG